MELDDIAYVLALTRVEGAGNTVARKAIQLSIALQLPLNEIASAPAKHLLQHVPTGEFDATLRAMRRVTDDALERAQRHAARMLHHGAACVGLHEDTYPTLLAHHLGDAAPAMLWCAGNRGLLDTYGAGIVGTRAPSADGAAIAADCARVFADAGITVVSGGADGIDTAAHRAALDAGGTTVVVLPQGLRTYRFPEYIRDAVETNRCALISQFDPEMTWQTHAAVTRNATIAALSKLVCVIEPRRMGGSMRTAKHARDQGKSVMYYVAENGDAFETVLRRAGGTPVLRNDRSLDSDQLLAQFHANPATLPEQGQLL